MAISPPKTATSIYQPVAKLPRDAPWEFLDYLVHELEQHMASVRHLSVDDWNIHVQSSWNRVNAKHRAHQAKHRA
jgi:hypothetical protein